MALYRYTAFSAEGKKVSGTIDAPTLQSAKDQLSRQGIYPITIALTSQEANISWWRRLFGGGISEKEKILFTRQLAVLLKAGVPLLQALELLTEQFEGTTRSLVVSIKDAIKEGGSFADALARFPKTFDVIYVQLVRAGEASGKLDVILNRLVMYLERRAEIAKRVKSALRNPLIQLIVAGLVVGVMMVFVVPQLAENFAGQGKELPGPTQLVLTISGILRKWYLPLAAFFIILIVAFRWWRSTPSGARMIDQIKLRIPMVKYFARTSAVVQFSYTLGILLESGVNLAQALDIVVDSIDNQILADTLNEARDKIIKQGRIAQYLKQTDLFPAIAIYLINTGEQSGQLDTMLLTVAAQYEEELSDLTDSLTARLGPILLIVMAIIVGFIVVSIALPIMQMGDLAGA